jgi:hypothetical protein
MSWRLGKYIRLTSVRFATLENLNYIEDINRASENITQNFETQHKTVYVLTNSSRINHTHFPYSEAMVGGVAHATAGRDKRLDWRVATKVVTYGRNVWATDSFTPHKKPRNGWDIPGPITRGTGSPCPLPGEDASCLPGEWLCSSYVAPDEGNFVPKPGRDSYGGHKNYRPLILTSFCLIS